MAFPASLPFLPSTDSSSPDLWPRRFGRQRSHELSAPWDSAEPVISGGRREGRRGTCPSAIAGGFYGKLLKAGEASTSLGQCRAGEKVSHEQSGLFCMSVGKPSASQHLSWR